MSPAGHDRLVESGLLGGSLRAEARAEWPDWARAHLEECEICQDLLHADALARLGTAPRRPRPDTSALQERLEARRPPPIEALTTGLPAFDGARWRSGPVASAIEIRRTHTRVSASDPEASHLLLFGATPSQGVTLLGEAHQEGPGVVVDAAWSPAGEGRVVAISARAALDPRLWELWLADTSRAGWPARLEVASERLHVADVVVASAEQGLVRLREGDLPPTTDEVTAILRPAAEHGRSAHLEPAALGYQQALELARRKGDVTGEIKATLGLAQALNGLGYELEAEARLSSLAATHELDRPRGALLCRSLASRAHATGDLDLAERWVAEAERMEGPTGWVAIKRVELAMARGDAAGALPWLERFEAGLPEHGAIRDLARAWCLAALGRADEVVEPLPHADHPRIEVALWRMTAAARLDAAHGRGHDWGRSLAELSARLREDRAALTMPVAQSLLRLAEEARAAAPQVASVILRLRFLDVEDAADPRVQALCVSAVGARVLVEGPAFGAGPRELPIGRAELMRLVAAAQSEVELGSGDESLRHLGEMLFPEGAPEAEIAMASDGALSDLPLTAVLATRVPAGRPLPPVRLVTRPGLRARRDPALTAIASLADAAGDLPAAAAEVLPHEAAVHLRGPEATFASLAALPPVGLLHIGVHSRRDREVATLQFADRAVGPVDIGTLRFEGGPVVFLTGCATAQRSAGAGVERSLADAWLSAGASAVIATRWSVDDVEMSRVVRAHLARWPFDSAAEAVSSVVDDLRNLGSPRRCWAGLVVYQPWPSAVGRSE